MENSGLAPWLKSAFASVQKMLIGKKFPMNMRALRLTVMELLRGYFDDIDCFDDFRSRLMYLSTKSKTAQHWVNNLVEPVL